MENIAKRLPQEEQPKELDETLAKIASDAAKNPAAYLEESKVPEGGE